MLKEGGLDMEKARRRVRFCVLLVVCVAVIMGIVYYYNGFQQDTLQNEGTLIAGIDTIWRHIWQ